MDTMQSFIYQARPSRVIFGAGKVTTLPDEMSRQDLSAPLILTTPHQTQQGEQLVSILDGKVAGLFSGAVMHTPTTVTMEALAYAETIHADAIVSIGGGSTIGLGKAIAIRTGLPHICIPTTYAGSEMTPVLGELDGGVKKTRTDPKIQPGTVIYDVNLTLSLPAGLSATSGINAIAHAVEALYAENANPVIALLALEGIAALAKSLPSIAADPSSLTARSEAQYGAWLCGLCLGSVGMALHHKICHAVAGSFNLPHAETHANILPHALAYNAPKIPSQMEKLAEVLPGSNGDAILGMNALLDRLGISRGLKSYGFRSQDISRATDIAVSNSYYNPREIDRDLIQEVIRRAYAGEDARADL